ncbi:MAG: hypothetical protein Q9175_000326 [Cornicularia normoerica]
MADLSAFFYGTLMAPQVLYRVVYGTTNPTPSQISRLIIEPAILPQYTRRRVRDCDYPAIIPSREPGACVRGTYVRGLTSDAQRRLDLFEGSQYERIRLRLNLLDEKGNEGEEMEAETYVWAEDIRGLEDGEWDFEEFRREKMGRWIGNDEEYEVNIRMVEVDEAVERKDPTGGRRVNGEIGGKLETKGKSEEVVLESAVQNGALFWKLQYSARDDSNVVSMNAHPDLNSTVAGTVMIATRNAPGGPYLTLNQTECSVRFIPNLFDISVNISSSVITVHYADFAPDMDPTAQPNAAFTAWGCHTLLDTLASLENSTTGCGKYTAQGQPGLGNIATRALRQLNDLSMLDTSLHTSSRGDMFLSLIQNEILYDEHTTSYQNWNITDFDFDISGPNTTNNASIKAYSIEQGLKSLIDDSLFAFASAQLVLHYENSS